MRFIYIEEIDSTNNYAKELAKKGEGEGTIVIADRQTAGRGRVGKKFFSPDATGLYYSLILRPSFSLEEVTFITSAAAVSTVHAIEKVLGVKCGIKWVNDLYLDNKKVCGILCEAAPCLNGGAEYVILGIGINLLPPKGGFPAEIENIAGALLSECENIRETKMLLAENITDIFFRYYKNFESHSFIPEYQNLSLMEGKRITVLGDTTCDAVALGVDDRCRLIVQKDGGEKFILSSGEVSIKFNDF